MKPAPRSNRTCETCFYWVEFPQEISGTRAGECRRNPPQVIIVPAPDIKPHPLETKVLGGQSIQAPAQLTTIFPPIGAEGWCGRYTNKMSS